MDIACIAEKSLVPRGGTEPYNAMKSALKDDGHTIITANSPVQADLCLLWSVQFRVPKRQKIFDWYRKRGIPVLIIEVGALQRNILWRVALNNIDNTGQYGLGQPQDPQRPNDLGINLEPWRYERGENIYICLQNDRCANWPHSENLNQWLINTVRKLRRTTERPIVIRPHPRKREPIPPEVTHTQNVRVEIPQVKNTDPDGTDFQRILDDAWAVVNVSSNPGVEAVISGVPVFVAHNNLAASVGRTDVRRIENPVMPDRTDWLQDMIHREWSIDEIRQGIPWQRIKPYT